VVRALTDALALEAFSSAKDREDKSIAGQIAAHSSSRVRLGVPKS